MNTHQVLLYYKYIDTKDPKTLCEEQKKLCQKLKLKGRIIVANEGINGTLEGKTKDTENYIKSMQKLSQFSDISFKKSKGTGSAFPKLSVKVRSEIVALGRPDLNPNQISGKYLSADELNSWFEQRKEFYIVDMRNDYEYLSGYFEGSLFSNTHNFYDLPKVLPKLSHLKGKTVVTVCTGGVRCEKASGFLLSSGFKDVYQLKDGIQSYIEKYPNKYFKGKLYVFDNRLTLGVNKQSLSARLQLADAEVVGECMKCRKASDSYVNCAYDFCHYHYICCDDCKDKELNLPFCKEICKEKFLTKNQLTL